MIAFATLQQRSSKDDCELPRPQRVDSPLVARRLPSNAAGASAAAPVAASRAIVGAGGQLQHAGRSAQVASPLPTAHFMSTAATNNSSMSPSAETRAARSKRVAFAPNTPDNERLRAEVQTPPPPLQQLQQLPPLLFQQPAAAQNAAASVNIYEIPRMQQPLRTATASGHELAGGGGGGTAGLFSPLDKRRKHNAGAGVGAPRNNAAANEPSANASNNAAFGAGSSATAAAAVSAPIPIPVAMQMPLAAIATPEQSRAWRWTRNNSVEHESLPLQRLAALQLPQQQQPPTSLAPQPLTNGGEAARYSAQRQSEPQPSPVYCRLSSGSLPVPALLSVTKVEEAVSAAAPQIVTAPLDKTLVDLLVLIGMPVRSALSVSERFCALCSASDKSNESPCLLICS